MSRVGDAEDVDDVEAMFRGFRVSEAAEVGGATSPPKKRTTDVYSCVFCGEIEGPSLIEGEWMCTACNSLVEKFVDHGAEWRTFSCEEGRGPSNDVSRCGHAPSSDLISSLGCTLRVGGGGSSRSRQSRSGVGAHVMAKYQAWNSLTYRERTLCKVFDRLSVYAASKSIPWSIVTEAKAMYKEVSLGRLFRGDTRSAVEATCMYMACRSCHAPRTINEISELFEVKMSSMIRACKMFHEAMPERRFETTGSTDLVARFCERVGMDAAHTEICRAAVRHAEELSILGDSAPASAVAGAIHMVNMRRDLGLKRDDIARACLVATGKIGRAHV